MTEYRIVNIDALLDSMSEIADACENCDEDTQDTVGSAMADMRAELIGIDTPMHLEVRPNGMVEFSINSNMIEAQFHGDDE